MHRDRLRTRHDRVRTCKVIGQQKKVPRHLRSIRKRRYEAIVNFFEEQNFYKFKKSPERESEEYPELMSPDVTRDNSTDRKTPEDLAIPSCSSDPWPTRPVKKNKSVKTCRPSKNKKLKSNLSEATPTTKKTYATKETQTNLIITNVHEGLLRMIDDHLANSFANRSDINDISGLLSLLEQQVFMSAMLGMPQQHPQWMPQQHHFNPANIPEFNNNYVAERTQDVQIEEIPVSTQDEEIEEIPVSSQYDEIEEIPVSTQYDEIEELPVYNIQETEKESSVEVTSTTKNPAKNQPKKKGFKRKRLFTTKKSKKTTASKRKRH